MPNYKSNLSSQKKQQGLSTLDLLLSAVVIGILVVIALYFLQKRIEQAEQAALQTMSRNFTASMAMLRNKWIVEGRKNSNGYPKVMLDDDTVYLNTKGWPVSTTPKNSNDPQTAQQCLQLWDVIMQNGIPATTEGLEPRGSETYHISAPDRVRCRYELAQFDKEAFYFDYQTQNGKVNLHIQEPSVDKNNH